jgi:hypothetical protein
LSGESLCAKLYRTRAFMPCSIAHKTVKRRNFRTFDQRYQHLLLFSCRP